MIKISQVILALTAFFLASCATNVRHGVPPILEEQQQEPLALKFKKGVANVKLISYRRAPIPEPSHNLSEKALAEVLLDEETSADKPAEYTDIPNGIAFEDIYADYDLTFSDLEYPPYIFECRGTPVRPPPIRRAPRRPLGIPPPDTAKPRPWELSLRDLCHRARAEQSKVQMQRQLEQLNSAFAAVAALSTDVQIDNWRKLNPADLVYKNKFGCTVDHIARWEEGGTNPFHPWQRYQTNVTGQLGAYVVRSPSRRKVSFDGIRVLGPKIIVGIEAKAIIDPTNRVKMVADWIDQAKRQTSIAKECGFRVAWIIGVSRAHRTMQSHLFNEGVEEVFYSRATRQGGGELYERLLGIELERTLGPSVVNPP